MSYTGVFTIRDILSDLLVSAEWTALLTTVGTEQSVTLPALKAVSTSQRQTYDYPYADILGLDTEHEWTNTAVKTTAEGWLILADKDADTAALDKRLIGYQTALIRLLGERSSLSPHTYSCEVTDGSPSPPGAVDDGFVQAVGVRVRVALAEER